VKKLATGADSRSTLLGFQPYCEPARHFKRKHNEVDF
jgi:hypothetical protein